MPLKTIRNGAWWIGYAVLALVMVGALIAAILTAPGPVFAFLAASILLGVWHRFR